MWFVPLSILAGFLVSAAARAEACLDEVTWYTRTPGQYTDVEHPEKKDERKLILDNKKQQRVKMNDVQYEAMVDVTGYRFTDLAAMNDFAKHGDTALLHFGNGMVIPHSLSDTAYNTQLDLFVACGYFDGGRAAPFPRADRSVPEYRDPKPVTFRQNKIVVKTKMHPLHQYPDRSGFTPWRHADSLVAIEIVTMVPYFAQFAPSDQSLGDGLGVYMSRCQYCHGLRKIGASFGWNFTGPWPLHVRRDVDSLLAQVKNDNPRAFETGSVMPHQKDISLTEVQSLWKFVRHMSERPSLNSYEPPR